MIDARLYLVSGARLAAGDLADAVPDLAAGGVDLIQLREKDMETKDLLRAGEPVAAACRAAGIFFIVNDRPDVALALGADGVHVGQSDLPVEVARRVIGTGIVGLSTHAPEEIDRALSQRGLDYVAVGPVHETPTKPGRTAAGLELVRYAAQNVEIPWFAIGGIDETTLPAVMNAGAGRIVVVRAITEASDPAAAAAGLRTQLDTRESS